MPDEIQDAIPSAEIIATEETPSAEIKSTETPATQPIEEPAWKAKYPTPEKMWDENRKFMSDAERLRRENDQLKRQTPQPQVDPAMQREKRLERFVQDPDAVLNEAINQAMGPLAVQVILTSYLSDHPEAKQYRTAMKDALDSNPGLLSLPNGLHALYLLAKDDATAQNTDNANRQIAEHRDKVQESKITDAYVEPATQPKRTAPTTLKEGMTIAESEKALAALGIETLKEY